jgi:hypothetical protein
MATPTNLPAATSTGEVLTSAYVNDLRGAFRVLQVVYATTTTQTTTTSSTYATTTLTASITPQASSSKILVFTNTQFLIGDPLNTLGLRITRLIAGSPTTVLTNDGAASAGNSSVQGLASQISLDAPATTSAITYRQDFARASGANTIYTQFSSNPSTMVLMEISA